MDELQRYYKESLLANLCDEYKGYWQKTHGDKEKLMRLVLMQQSAAHFADFCYRGKGLSKEYILVNFDEYINGKRTFENVEGVDGYTYQLYVGYDKDFEITADVTYLMWCDGSQIVIEPTKCSVLYISNRSNVHLVGDGYNNINVKLFDKSKITIDDLDENSTVVVYKYSDDAQVELGKYCLASVRVFDKKLKL